ncbi:MAG: rhodanese-like domain-containing protein [Bacillota bacterium]
MLRILVMKKRTLYIGLAVLLAVILGIFILISVSKSDETFSETLKYAYKKISAEQAKILIEKNPQLVIIDIRDEEDYLTGHLPQAIQMSLNELKKKMDYFDKESIYVIYGGSDKKSEKFADAMAKNGFPRIYMLNGGIEKWPYSTE